MKKLDLGQTITILANVGVIAGIVFLAIEVRQNQTTLEEGHAMNQIVVENNAQEHFSYFRALILENDALFEIWQKGFDGAELTDSEQAKFDELCTEHIFRMLQAHRMRFRLDAESEYRAAARNELRPALQGDDFFDFVRLVEGGR